MKALAARRSRVARVRRIQHARAAADAAEAQGRLEALEGSAARLAELRGLLLADGGRQTGMALAAAHELAGRLDEARSGLSGAIDGARATAEAQAERRMTARRDQESAEKLDARAAAAFAAWRERRGGAAGRRRTLTEGDEA